MADAVLSVEIGADIQKLTNGLDKANKDVAGFSSKASKDLANLDKSALKSGQSLSSFSNGSNKAAFALTNLGRVAQDAPFGFIGIQNNLNPLLESFQQLRKESGSTGGALKALGSSLIGPAGIGIALSVVSAGILLYQQYVQKSNKATDDAEKATVAYKDSLTGLNKVIYEGQTAGGEEISRLSTLFRATQNLSLSVNERAKAVKALQDKYPSYFSNLTTENALTSEATKNYNLLKQEIVATAIARAADKDNAKQGEKIFENLEKRKAAQKEILRISALISDLSKNGGDLAPKNINEIAYAKEDIVKLKKEISSYDLALKNANTSIYNNSQLQDAIVRKFGVQAIVTDKATTSTKELRKELEKLTGIDVAGIEKENAQKGIDITNKVKPIIEGIIKQLDSEKEPVKLPIPVDPVLIGVTPVDPKEFENQLGLMKLAEKLNEDLSDLIGKSLGETLGNAFTSIGDALANGGNPIEAFGNEVLKGFGSFLSQFGTLLIQYGIAATAFGKLQASLLVPGAAIISAPLAIAAGLALKIASGAISGLVSGKSSSGGQGYQIPHFATGVTGFSGGLALVGERGPELVNLPTGSNVITNQNTQALIRGGNRGNTQTIIPDVRISGQDLVVVFNRAEKVNSRR